MDFPPGPLGFGDTIVEAESLPEPRQRGYGVYEIRLSIDKNIYRTAYVAKFSDVVCVLHCWQKKTQATSDNDKAVIVKRYREAKDHCNE